MRNIWTIAKREYNQYFISPIAYVVAVALLTLVGGYFAILLLAANQQAASGFGFVPGINEVNNLFAFLLLIASPALTMRLLADETRTGTIELLLTAPVRDFELVFGKWLGSFLFVLSLIAVTFIYPVILNNLVSPGIDQKALISSYLGLILLSASFLAIAWDYLLSSAIKSLLLYPRWQSLSPYGGSLEFPPACYLWEGNSSVTW